MEQRPEAHYRSPRASAVQSRVASRLRRALLVNVKLVFNRNHRRGARRYGGWRGLIHECAPCEAHAVLEERWTSAVPGGTKNFMQRKTRTGNN